MKYYAGIGARNSPPEILEFMTEIASLLEKRGWILRSGGAEGADSAFASGVEKNAEIWIPWSSYGKPHNLNHTYKILDKNDIDAYNSVRIFHPAPDQLRDSWFSLMARNYRQIKGFNAPDSKFVICWTPNGELKGGTAQAIKISRNYNIPVFNLAIENDYRRILDWKHLS